MRAAWLAGGGWQDSYQSEHSKRKTVSILQLVWEEEKHLVFFFQRF